jgi:hypothetical protein
VKPAAAGLRELFECPRPGRARHACSPSCSRITAWSLNGRCSMP